MDLVGPPSCLRVAYESLGANPTVLASDRIMIRLDSPALEQSPHRNVVNQRMPNHVWQVVSGKSVSDAFFVF